MPRRRAGSRIVAAFGLVFGAAAAIIAGGRRVSARPSPLVGRLLRAPVLLYRWRLGWLTGERFLLLTHLGRRSGRLYRTPLEVVATTPTEVVVLAGLGRRADWVRNIDARPALEVEIGRRRFVPVHRVLDEAEAATVLADYERRHRLIAPAVRRVLSWLVGWRYDGSALARRRLARELPVIAFRPAGCGG